MKELYVRPLSLGTSSFPALRKDNQIYVDKTELIYELAKQGNRSKIFLARPRRFGKSLLVSTFESLFKYGLRDFKGLAIERLWKDKTYSVVRLDFTGFNSLRTIEDFQIKLQSIVASAFYPLGFRFNREDKTILFIDQLKAWLDSLPLNSLVLLIDEYDVPLTNLLNNHDLFDQIRDALSDFYSALKQCDSCMRFFFMTGITRCSNTSIFSGFNAFTDISMSVKYGALLGITEEEIKGYFSEYLDHAASVLKMSSEDVLKSLRENYDGFSFDRKASSHVYTPWSILKFFDAPEDGFINYWYASAGQPTVLTEYLDSHALSDPKEYLKRPRVKLTMLETAMRYEEIQMEVLLAHSGYLTFKSVDDAQTVTLGYPNREVASSIAQLYADRLLMGNAINEDDSAPTVLQTLTSGSAEDVFQMFNRVVNTVIYTSKAWCDEEACRSSMHVLLLGAALLPRVESPTGRGRSDMDVEVAGRYWVFEFKYAKTRRDVDSKLNEAVEQIQSRRYGETLHGKTLIRVALVFCSEERCFAAYREVGSQAGAALS